MYSLIVNAKMNKVDPQAWLANVLARVATHSVQHQRHLPRTVCLGPQLIHVAIQTRSAQAGTAFSNGVSVWSEILMQVETHLDSRREQET